MASRSGASSGQNSPPIHRHAFENWVLESQQSDETGHTSVTEAAQQHFGKRRRQLALARGERLAAVDKM